MKWDIEHAAMKELRAENERLREIVRKAHDVAAAAFHGDMDESDALCQINNLTILNGPSTSGR